MNFNLFNNIEYKKIKFNQGFSLLELVIALGILGILMYGVANVVKTVRDFDHFAENKVYLISVKSALLSFVQVNGFLPCPDVNGDGVEDREITPEEECTFKNGRIPYLDLGVNSIDSWGQSLYYAVNDKTDAVGVLDIDDVQESASYFNTDVTMIAGQSKLIPYFRFDTKPQSDTAPGAGNYKVCSESSPLANGCDATNGFKIEQAAVAVVVSFGSNAAETWQAIDAGVSPGLDAAETVNADGSDLYFWQAQGSNITGQFYDDQLFWITGHEVKYSIIKSGSVLQ